VEVRSLSLSHVYRLEFKCPNLPTLSGKWAKRYLTDPFFFLLCAVAVDKDERTTNTG